MYYYTDYIIRYSNIKASHGFRILDTFNFNVCYKISKIDYCSEKINLTSVPAGRPNMNPSEQTAKVMDPSQDLRPDGLMAMMPWITVWNNARHWPIPNMIRLK